MSIEQEALKSVYDEKEAEKVMFDEVASGGVGPVEEKGSIGIDFGFLLAKTGDGPISEYLNHPLNSKNSEGVAQILRGFTGIFGSLDYGIIDVALGSIKVAQERKGKIEPKTDELRG
jgi:hypothetical protein